MNSEHEHIGFRVPASLKERLRALSEKDQRSLSSFCRLLLDQGVDTYQKKFGKRCRHRNS